MERWNEALRRGDALRNLRATTHDDDAMKRFHHLHDTAVRSSLAAEANDRGLAPDAVDDGHALDVTVADRAALISPGNRSGTKFTVFNRNNGSG